MTSIKGIKSEHIVNIYQFGSSVEGKRKPNDIDIFVIVKNGKYKFRTKGGLPVPFVCNSGEYQYFVMPEEGGEDLLNTMLYIGRKDPDRNHKGKVVQLSSIPS